MTPVLELDRNEAAERSDEAVRTLEAGGLILLPRLGFALGPGEASLFDPARFDGDWARGRVKNLSYDPETGRLAAKGLDGAARERLPSMMARYADQARALLTDLAPGYAPRLQRRRTSFRPGAVDVRAISPRKDDRRLHVDAFPASPVQGRRILRVFTNADPSGRPRVWNVGEPFEAYAARFLPRVGRPAPAAALALQALGLTRGRRSPYDHTMLRLHDLAKLDADYAAAAPRREIAFPAGATWVVFTDAVPHAALSGRFALEQTFLLPVEAMAAPERSPLKVLERLTGRLLAGTKPEST